LRAVIDPSATAFFAAAIERAGVRVVVSRATGYAPNVVIFSAEVKAKELMVAPDTGATARDGSSASAPGAVTQNDRTLIVMERALRDKRFPLPLQKGDLVALPDSAEQFSVSRVDAYTRAIAGAITLTVTGVA
jgi:hypothetical protein